MAGAGWNDRVVAESERVEETDGHVRLPIASVRRDLLEPSDRRTGCPKRGEAHDDRILVGSERIVDAARRYPEPKPPASRIEDHVAFWRGVTVER